MNTLMLVVIILLPIVFGGLALLLLIRLPKRAKRNRDRIQNRPDPLETGQADTTQEDKTP